MLSDPKSSTPIIVQASGVFVAPAKTAIKPSPAKRSTGEPLIVARVLPNVAPIKNNGVTSPPLKPVLNVIAVRRRFQSQLHVCEPFTLKAETMLTSPVGLVTPKPR